jgi:hypothetical protein
MNIDPIIFTLDKTTKHGALSCLCFFRVETNFTKIFVLNEGRRTETGYSFIYLVVLSRPGKGSRSA